MEMKKTEKGIKKYTTSEKLAILREGQEKGVKATLAKYGLFPATYYYWKKEETSDLWRRWTCSPDNEGTGDKD